MRAVAEPGERLGHLLQHCIIGEGPQQLEVTFAGLVHAGQDRIRDAERRFTPDAPARNSVPAPHAAVSVRCRLERADDGRPDGNDAPVFRLCALDRCRSVFRDAIGLVEREAQVERRMSGRGDAGGVRQRGKVDAAPPPDGAGVPVERKSGRRWLERDRVGGKSRPDVPQSQRFGDVRVLDRPSVSRKPGDDGCAITQEAQLEQAGIVESRLGAR